MKQMQDLIETLWNVKDGREVVENPARFGFNRDIVECKYRKPGFSTEKKAEDLIETLWNVKVFCDVCRSRIGC